MGAGGGCGAGVGGGCGVSSETSLSRWMWLVSTVIARMGPRRPTVARPGEVVRQMNNFCRRKLLSIPSASTTYVSGLPIFFLNLKYVSKLPPQIDMTRGESGMVKVVV